jgi:hypothetical protein
MLLIGAALITGGSALASAQPIENHNWAYSNHDRDDYRRRDRDDRRVYEQRRMHWDGYRWVY